MILSMLIRIRKLGLVLLFAFFALQVQGEGAYLTGTVLGQDGRPESGVWVIAETEDLPTEYRKIVVTESEGRFLVPDLPKTPKPLTWTVWVRGYGLIDSPHYPIEPNRPISIHVEKAEAKRAAQIYPSNYWMALIDVESGVEEPTDSQFSDKASWLNQFKLNCVLCHQMGSTSTRLPGKMAYDHGLLKARGMNVFAEQLGRDRLLKVLEKWSAKLISGKTPPMPPRPAGIERNVVITQWGWGDQYTYAHDEIATDKRDPLINANGPIWGVDLANDYLLKVDPVEHKSSRIKIPTRGNFGTPWCEQTFKSLTSEQITDFGFGSLGCPEKNGATPYLGRYDNPANPHNPMMDSKGNIWLTTQIRRQWAEDLPAFCRDNPAVSDRHHHRQLGRYDPIANQFSLIDTCFGTHHLQFDAQDRLWTSGDNFVIGWLDTKLYDGDRPETLEKALGFSEIVIDSDGDSLADKPIVGFRYGIIPNPVDESIWSAVPPGLASTPGQSGWLERYDPKKDSHELYRPPKPGMGPRGVDVDSKGIIWTALAGSGHLASFDREKCSRFWGDGDQCTEGWKLWQTPGPTFSGAEDAKEFGSADMHYYLWVDQFNTLGLGKDIVIVNGTASDSLIAFNPDNEKFTVIRIPYPLNTYTRGLDGRIDKPELGWKGRGVWFTNGLDPIMHSEVPKSYVGKVQIRPNPLAK